MIGVGDSREPTRAIDALIVGIGEGLIGDPAAREGRCRRAIQLIVGVALLAENSLLFPGEATVMPGGAQSGKA